MFPPLPSACSWKGQIVSDLRAMFKSSCLLFCFHLASLSGYGRKIRTAVRWHRSATFSGVGGGPVKPLIVSPKYSKPSKSVQENNSSHVRVRAALGLVMAKVRGQTEKRASGAVMWLASAGQTLAVVGPGGIMSWLVAFFQYSSLLLCTAYSYLYLITVVFFTFETRCTSFQQCTKIHLLFLVTYDFMCHRDVF